MVPEQGNGENSLDGVSVINALRHLTTRKNSSFALVIWGGGNCSRNTWKRVSQTKQTKPKTIHAKRFGLHYSKCIHADLLTQHALYSLSLANRVIDRTGLQIHNTHKIRQAPDMKHRDYNIHIPKPK